MTSAVLSSELPLVEVPAGDYPGKPGYSRKRGYAVMIGDVVVSPPFAEWVHANTHRREGSLPERSEVRLVELA